MAHRRCHQSSPPSRRLSAFALAPAMVLAAVLAVAACDDGNGAEQEAAAQPEARPVRVLTVAPHAETEIRHFPGRVQAAQASEVSFQVSGRLAEFPVREGSTVERGAVIAALDPTDYRIAVREAEVQVDRLGKDLERKRILRSEGHVAQAVLDEAQAQYDLAAARLDQARQNLAYTTIEAPYRAVVASRLVDTFINIQAGQPVALLQDVSSLDVQVSVPERMMAQVQRDDVVRITATLSARPDRRFPLELKEVATEPDPQTRTYPVTFTMAPPDDIAVLPGMSATVTAEITEPGAGSIRIPTGALVAAADGRFQVWLLDPQAETVRPQPVQPGTTVGDQVIILDGLSGGETIVAAGAGFLADGQRVRPQAPTDPQAARQPQPAGADGSQPSPRQP